MTQLTEHQYCTFIEIQTETFSNKGCLEDCETSGNIFNHYYFILFLTAKLYPFEAGSTPGILLKDTLYRVDTLCFQ